MNYKWKWWLIVASRFHMKEFKAISLRKPESDSQLSKWLSFVERCWIGTYHSMCLGRLGLVLVSCGKRLLFDLRASIVIFFLLVIILFFVVISSYGESVQGLPLLLLMVWRGGLLAASEGWGSSRLLRGYRPARPHWKAADIASSFAANTYRAACRLVVVYRSWIHDGWWVGWEPFGVAPVIGDFFATTAILITGWCNRAHRSGVIADHVFVSLLSWLESHCLISYFHLILCSLN